MSEGGVPIASRALRLRASIQSAIEASQRHGFLWGLAGVVALTMMLSHTPLGLRFENLVVGQPAPRDIVVPVGVDIPDEARTSAMRDAARRRMPPAYVYDSSASARADRALSEAFEAGRRMTGGTPQDGRARAADPASLASVLAALPPALDPAVVESLAKDRFSETRERSLRQAARTLNSRMIVARADALPPDRPISVRTLGEERREDLVSDFSRILDLDAARADAVTAGRAVAAESPGAGDAASAARLARSLGALLEALVEPTLTLDQEETSRRMEEAARGVPALLARIERGSVLVRRGFPLTEETVSVARAIEAARPSSLEAGPLAGTACLCALLFGFLWVYPRYLRADRASGPRLFPQLVLLIVSLLAMAWILLFFSSLVVDRFEPPFDRIETLLYLIPVAAGGLLAALLFPGRTAMVYSIFFSVPYAILAGWDMRVLVFSLVTNFAAIYGASQYRARTALMNAGFIVGCCGAVAAVALDLTAGTGDWRLLVADAVAALAGGCVGAVLLVSFLLPICEGLFGVLTDVRLLELFNRNNPLLSQLAAAAPGSYNHSLIVGTLAEAAAEAIGANGLYCRVAAVYHDIGKMKAPEYYIENQRAGMNPHDPLPPLQSKAIIEDHVKEGMRLAREHALPRAIADVIPEHHGTRVMTYFYEKARAQAEAAGSPGSPAAEVDPDAFRYPGPKPRSRETAIFMLADSVEAASRTIDRPDARKFREMIRQISTRVVLDGQFDDCDLTFRDLDLIVESFVHSLMAIYHRRVDYPTYEFERPEGEGGSSRGRGPS